MTYLIDLRIRETCMAHNSLLNESKVAEVRVS